jgi:FkbM family methyltransferase
VFDIGSHLGYFTCLAGILAPLGEVHTFEVDPKCIPLIKKNLRVNKLNNFVINNCAVSDQDNFEKIALMSSPNPCLKINSDALNFQEIAAIKIDDYARTKNIFPNFIKIDVEGAEWKVLKGMEEVLGRDDIKLLIEVHVEALAADFNNDYKKILAWLQDKGFY